MKIGVIADDFTGAGDVASFLKSENINSILLNGVPKEKMNFNNNIEVIIIALKIRSIPKEKAIEKSVMAYNYLQKYNCEKIYYKYASTFNSTVDGNIGPVLDNFLEVIDINYTIISPALPINNRVVKEGQLFVDGLPIYQTYMKDHPVTPMHESDLKILMDSQSKYRTFKLTIPQIKDFILDSESFDKFIDEKTSVYGKFYLSVDYFEEKHGILIAQLFNNLRLYSGSSVLPAFIYKDINGNINNKLSEDVLKNYDEEKLEGAILAGSLSEITQHQISELLKEKNPFYVIKNSEITENYETVKEKIIEFIDLNRKNIFIIFSEDRRSDDLEEHYEIGKLIEDLMAYAGKYVIKNGIKNLIIAGGETSGAVIDAIDNEVFHIGEVISPGIPILIPDNNKGTKIVLKSGNFGEKNFFINALKIML